MNRAVFEPRTPGRNANTIFTELKRILPNAVVRFFFSNRDEGVNERVVSRKNTYISDIS